MPDAPVNGVSEELVVELLTGNGDRLNLRKTHFTLWLRAMTMAIGSVALALNFLIFQPTFLILHAPNELWGACFLALGLGLLFTLEVRRSFTAMRMLVAAGLVYISIIVLGTGEPWWDYYIRKEDVNPASLQLPIWILMAAVSFAPILLDPFIGNPTLVKKK